MRLRLLLCTAALALSLSACKQGEGDVCQIDDDCEDGLNCNAGTGLCQGAGTSSFDAAPPGDAAQLPDGGPPDAAPADAGDEPDAAAVDAAAIDAG